MDKKQLDDIVFEALFRQAVIDGFEEEINAIQLEAMNNEYTPSPKFKMRIEKLFKADDRKTFIRKFIFYTKKVASILFIALGLIFSMLLFNKKVQATVNKVIIEIYEKFNSIIFRGEQSSFEEKEWILNYIPEGYILKEHKNLKNITNIKYKNAHGNEIILTYRLEINNTSISVDNENHEMKEIRILNKKAFLMIAKNDSFDNGIMWNMEGYRFELWGSNTIDELEKMAESISKK